ncbi:MAG: hypothetical protein MK193_14145 [Lentisphaeria bacterium]|nr:hypothetical protein [Lentisphaeria bacterium]
MQVYQPINVHLFLLTFFLFSLSTFSYESAKPSDESYDQLSWKVYKIFKDKCSDCHGGHKRYKEFGYILDLPRLLDNEDFIIKGYPEESYLYELLLEADPEMIMPPAKNDRGIKPMTPAEIETVRRWIIASSPEEDPDSVKNQANQEVKKQNQEAEPAKNKTIKQQIAYLHPVVVHFPIACLIAALFAEILIFIRPAMTWLIGASRWSLWLAAPFAIPTVLSGWNLADVLGYSQAIFNHRWLGVATLVVAITAAICNELIDRDSKKFWIVRILLVIGAILVATTGHTGGEVVHDYVD